MPTIPEWTFADRMRKALDRQGLTIDDMATILGTTEKTVRRYIAGGGKRGVPQSVMRVWSEETDTPVWWLEDKLPADGTFVERRRAVLDAERDAKKRRRITEGGPSATKWSRRSDDLTQATPLAA